ncbi:MAG TPA: imidazole glycerol phosphate synthase subunit HisH [Actinomycetota bacterium]|nr:imidazole glycerol phosphate synthase subunit HisH [Actinomycetota bacterium]
MTIAILDYGMGNLRSVARAIEHVGGKPEITEDAEAALVADGLVVPGVGHFGACVRNLRERGLDRAVLEFAESGRPLFGVCVGMQILFEGSEESDAAGLGLFEGVVRRLPSDVKVPHMGWNTVRWTERHPYVDGMPTGTRYYFVHSYAPDLAVGTTVGATEHGRPFAAAVARDNLFATQFHPEKSGPPGIRIYEHFVREAES